MNVLVGSIQAAFQRDTWSIYHSPSRWSAALVATTVAPKAATASSALKQYRSPCDKIRYEFHCSHGLPSQMNCSVKVTHFVTLVEQFLRRDTGAELDLFWQARGQNWGVEFKYEDAPRLTRSMKTAVEDLELERLWVVYPETNTLTQRNRAAVF